jgi:hypothetical protein
MLVLGTSFGRLGLRPTVLRLEQVNDIYERDGIGARIFCTGDCRPINMNPFWEIPCWGFYGLVRLANRLIGKESICNVARFEPNFPAILVQVYLTVTVVVTVTVS